MTSRDLHKAPFDEGTIAKLEIFEDYAEAWIPTFVMSGFKRIAIFDFFAGQGYDISNVPGSPIRILQKIKAHMDNIKNRTIKIDVYLNEYDKNKSDLLHKACEDFLSSSPEVRDVVELHFSDEDFKIAFQRLVPRIGNIPSLVYLDQNGIKAIASEYIQELEKRSQTDFLYFVSTSYLWRFAGTDEFKMHFDFDLSEAKKDPYRFIHRNLLNQIKNKLPTDTKLMLYPFTIKKGANIYGIIFGATHPRAADKFLGIAWKKNYTNGEANFDIDEDLRKSQGRLWGQPMLTKMENFEKNVRERILNGLITNNAEAIAFAYSQGHLGKHVAKVIREMKKEGMISYDNTSPLVTYENVYKIGKIIKYSIIKK